MKQLSIIIVNYNSAKFLEKCLESLKGQSEIPSSWEILIVDNASSEPINISFSGLSVEIIKNTNNLGFAKANNQAIKKSHGKYVLLLNPDTIVEQKALKELLVFMDQYEKCGAVSPKILLASGKIDDASHRGFPTPWRAFCYFSGLSSLFPNSTVFNGYHLGYQNMDKPHIIDAGVGACLLVRREAGEQIGWLDEDYFWYGEDLDLCYRLKQKGWQIWFNPNASIIHYKGVTSGIKKHSETISTATEQTRKQAQNARFDAMEIFYNKHYQQKHNFLSNLLVKGGILLLKKLFV